MPEQPDLTIYLEHLEARVLGRILQRVQVTSPFVLRTAVPPIGAAEGRRVSGVRRVGKRLVLGLEGGFFLVLHLMVAGRLRWSEGAKVKLPGRLKLASFEFENGTLALTEAGTKRRASLHLVESEQALAQLDPGGIEVLDSTLQQFTARLRRENHTLKRALTDPKLFSGIGNAYSDEILHRARLSPLALSGRLSEGDVARLYDATRGALSDWTARLRAAAAGTFPEKVTAFREGMAVHGRFRKPCPDCGSPVQRSVYAENECNYCAHCQTGGKLLADRALSRLLKKSWPRSIEEID
jgi:formamidopyrimidine-DNA glycosylase